VGSPPAAGAALEVTSREGKGVVVLIRLAATPIKPLEVVHESMTARSAVVVSMGR
jgi:hypothetical protein